MHGAARVAGQGCGCCNRLGRRPMHPCKQLVVTLEAALRGFPFVKGLLCVAVTTVYCNL
jgi:hypothetical protein